MLLFPHFHNRHPYRRTAKTRAIFPMALILFLMISFRTAVMPLKIQRIRELKECVNILFKKYRMKHLSKLKETVIKKKSSLKFV